MPKELRESYAGLERKVEARTQALQDALEQQTAISEILRVISSSPTDVRPVFDIIGERAGKLCDAEVSVVSRVDGDVIRLAAVHGVYTSATERMHAAFPMPVDAETVTARTIRNRSVQHVPDVLADSSYLQKDLARLSGYRAGLGVPMLRDGAVIGAIFVGRRAPGHFSDSQIALLETFADQAAIAIENVRLFNETKEALERQTAMSEILRVISRSPTDVQPVFDIIAERAVKLCDAEISVVSRVDGDIIRLAALYGVTTEGVAAIGRAFPMRSTAHTVSAQAVRNRSIVNVLDVLADPAYETREAARVGGFRGSLGVPMLCDDQAIGAIFVARAHPGLFTDRQVALLRMFADQAVIAVQNVRLFNQLEARSRDLARSVDELKALGEVGQAVSSTLDLETVLRTIVSRATQLAGVDGGSIYEYDEARQTFHLHTADGLPEALVQALRANPIRRGEGILGRMAQTLEPVQIPDIADETAYQSRVRELLIRCGYRALLAVPI
jgi:GAF domain-containing protein